MHAVTAKRPIPRVNKLAIKKDDTVSRKETSSTTLSPQQSYSQPNIQPQQPYPHHLPLIQPSLASLLMHSLQQQQAAINKLQLQMTAFMATYSPPTNYQSIINSSLQQYPTVQYSQSLPAPKQDHVFSHYVGPNHNDNNNGTDKPNTKKSKNANKKAANNNCNSFPSSISLSNSIALNNFVPLSPPMEEDCVNQFLIDDYPLVDHNDSSSLLLGPSLHTMSSLDLNHATALERIFSGNARFGPPN